MLPRRIENPELAHRKISASPPLLLVTSISPRALNLFSIALSQVIFTNGPSETAKLYKSLTHAIHDLLAGHTGAPATAARPGYRFDAFAQTLASDKRGITATDVWTLMLASVEGCSAVRAAEIARTYATPGALVAAYERIRADPSIRWGETERENRKERGTGSQRVFDLFFCLSLAASDAILCAAL